MGKFETSDGIKLSYEVDGDGPDVVLLHGYVADTFINWVRPGVTAKLNAAGYRTIALDQRGHGLSDKPHDPAAYSDDVMLGDVRGLLDHLSIEHCALVGYSMGAMNTLRLLISGEPRVDAAVLGGIGGSVLQSRAGGELIADAMEAEDKSTISHPFAKSFRDFADLVKGDKAALAALQRAPREPIRGVESVSVPVLVLVGDNDPMIGDPAELAKAIGGAEVAVVGGSHLNVVNNPAFHDALVAFLDRHKPGGA